jgi:putative protease
LSKDKAGNGHCIGEVVHYYNRIGVAVLVLAEPIHVGDRVHILGYSSDFQQHVDSLQIELQPVEVANPEQDVALKVDERVRRGDKVYKI